MREIGVIDKLRFEESTDSCWTAEGCFSAGGAAIVFAGQSLVKRHAITDGITHRRSESRLQPTTPHQVGSGSEYQIAGPK